MLELFLTVEAKMPPATELQTCTLYAKIQFLGENSIHYAYRKKLNNASVTIVLLIKQKGRNSIFNSKRIFGEKEEGGGR